MGSRAGAIAYGTAGAGVIAVALSVPLAPAQGCNTHQCDAPSPPPHFRGGRMIDPDTYESNALDEAWLPYPPNVELHVDYASIVGEGRHPDWIQSYIGVSQLANADGSNFTEGSGSIATYTDVSGSGFLAINMTCASYFARFVVHFDPVAAADGGAASLADAAAE